MKNKTKETINWLITVVWCLYWTLPINPLFFICEKYGTDTVFALTITPAMILMCLILIPNLILRGFPFRLKKDF